MFDYVKLYDRNHRVAMFAWEHGYDIFTTRSVHDRSVIVEAMTPKIIARWTAEEEEKARAYKHAALYDGADLFEEVGPESDDDMSE